MGEDNGPRSVRRWQTGTALSRTPVQIALTRRRAAVLGAVLAATLLTVTLLTGCAPTVTGSAVPAITPTSSPTSASASRPTTTTAPPPTPSSQPPQLPVTAACPLLSSAEVGQIYNLTVGAQEGPPQPQTGTTTYNCSYVNGAKQQLAALQVVVAPAATGDPHQYLDGYLHPFLAPGASARPISGLGAAAESYVKSDSGGPLAFVVAAVAPVGSGLDVVQFLASTSNANNPTATAQMVAVLRLALNRL